MVPFDDGWSFTPPGSAVAWPVTLPHAWNSEGWSYEAPRPAEPAGTGIYRKRLHGVGRGDALKFEGVALFCRILVDGKEVATNLGAHRAFEVPLDALREGDRILSRIGNGLDSGELMPVEYEYRDSGYSLTAVERRVGNGAILCTSLLLGTKRGRELVADILLNNLVYDDVAGVIPHDRIAAFFRENL